MMKKLLGFSLGICLAAAASLVHADEITVGQANKTFTPDTASAKVGDKVTFKNDDSVAHNVQVTNGDNKDNLGLLKPGESKSVDLTQPGTYDVQCLIHPKMKMTITVQ